MGLRPVRIGVVGCGDVLSAYMAIGSRMSAQGLIDVVAACARTEDRRDEVKSKYGIGSFTTDYHELVSSDQVDLVLVLTPSQMHSAISRAALEAGKDVLVEKPMAVSLNEGARLVELSRGAPGRLVCAPFVILSPTYQALWRQVADGKIGKIRSARALYGWAGPWWSEWFYKAGGGALFDFAVYNITSLTGFLGPARRVTAFAGTAIPERVIGDRRINVDVEDNAHLVIDFGKSTFALVSTGFTMQRYRRPAIELYGNAGTIQILGDDWAPQGYEMWENAPNGAAGAWKVFYETDPFWPWTDGLRHIVDCIQHQKQPLCTAEHAYHVLEIMIRAQESSRDGSVKKIESTFEPLNFDTTPEAKPAHLVHDPRGRG